MWRHKLNRESLPLILALLIPVGLVLIILFYYYGYGDNLFNFIFGIPLIYYVIIVPIVLGFLVAIAKWIRAD
jgi:hypothetical protein